MGPSERWRPESHRRGIHTLRGGCIRVSGFMPRLLRLILLRSAPHRPASLLPPPVGAEVRPTTLQGERSRSRRPLGDESRVASETHHAAMGTRCRRWLHAREAADMDCRSGRDLWLLAHCRLFNFRANNGLLCLSRSLSLVHTCLVLKSSSLVGIDPQPCERGKTQDPIKP